MKIDLCKIFGVEEGEEFEFDKYKGSRYKVINGRLEFLSDNCWVNSLFEFNEAIGCEAIKLPKRKEFTDDELFLFRKADKEYKWCTRDKDRRMYLFSEKPYKKGTVWYSDKAKYTEFHCYNHLFPTILWEDEEPVFIDDYVER